MAGSGRPLKEIISVFHGATTQLLTGLRKTQTDYFQGVGDPLLHSREAGFLREVEQKAGFFFCSILLLTCFATLSSGGLNLCSKALGVKVSFLIKSISFPPKPTHSYSQVYSSRLLYCLAKPLSLEGKAGHTTVYFPFIGLEQAAYQLQDASEPFREELAHGRLASNWIFIRIKSVPSRLCLLRTTCQADS